LNLCLFPLFPCLSLKHQSSKLNGAKRFASTSHARAKCSAFQEPRNSPPSDTLCTLPSDDRLQCSSALKHLAVHAIAHFELPRGTLYYTSIPRIALLASSRRPFHSSDISNVYIIVVVSNSTKTRTNFVDRGAAVSQSFTPFTKPLLRIHSNLLSFQRGLTIFHELSTPSHWSRAKMNFGIRVSCNNKDLKERP